MDEFGNLFITRPGTTNLPPLVLGSHLDTQAQGGNYDGIYGVLAALEVLEILEETGRPTARDIELVVWCNEEGVRFSPVTMGSGAYSGALDTGTVLATNDSIGTSVRDAVADCRRELVLGHHDARIPAAYLEAHIEQGPLLERDGVSIGVVTGIQGLRWFEVSVKGKAGHAGTVPMDLRRDALTGALTVIEGLRERAAATAALLVTTGRLAVTPGSFNTIPGDVVFSLDVRHPDDRVLDAFAAGLPEALELAAPCTASSRLLTRSCAVAFDQKVQATIDSSARQLGLSTTPIVSGATHDARNLATVCPTGMVFIPCRNGISHHPDEHADDHDLAQGAAVLLEAVLRLAE